MKHSNVPSPDVWIERALRAEAEVKRLIEKMYAQEKRHKAEIERLGEEKEADWRKLVGLTKRDQQIQMLGDKLADTEDARSFWETRASEFEAERDRLKAKLEQLEQRISDSMRHTGL